MSRGNSLIAGVVLIGMLGTLAVALQSANPQGESSAQVASAKFAAATPAADKTEPEALKQACEAGKDYRISHKFENGRDKGPAEITDFEMLDCSKPEKKTTDDGRMCENWECKVYYCEPSAIRGPRAAGEDVCKMVGKAKLGKDLEAGPLQQKALASAIEEAMRNPTNAETITEAARHAQDLPDAMQKQIAQSLGEETLSDSVESAAGDLKDRQDELDAIAAACDYQPNDPKCASAIADATAARDAAKLDKEALEKLRDQAKTITPGTPPPDDTGNTKPPPTTGCKTPPCPRTDVPPPDPPPCRGANCNRADQNGGKDQGGGGAGKGQQTFPPQQNQQQQQCSFFGSLFGTCQQQQLACTIQIMQSQQFQQQGQQGQGQQPVTLQWQTTGGQAQSATITQLGQVPPSGSAQVVPQSAVFYMHVQGQATQQGQSAQTAQCQTSGNQNPQQQCNNPQTYCRDSTLYYGVQGNNFCQTQTIQKCEFGCQTSPAGVSTSCASKPGDTAPAPTAELSCGELKIADVGMKVPITYACRNSVKAVGVGFKIANETETSGSAEPVIEKPPKGTNTVSYGLTCTAENGKTANAPVCKVQINKPSILLVANPQVIHTNDEKDDISTIGWVTPKESMKECVISSPTLAAFTAENRDKKATSGSVKTPKLSEDTKFILTCETAAEQTLKAEILVEVEG